MFSLAQSQPWPALRVFEDAEDHDEAEAQPGDLRGVCQRYRTSADRGPGRAMVRVRSAISAGVQGVVMLFGCRRAVSPVLALEGGG